MFATAVAALAVLTAPSVGITQNRAVPADTIIKLERTACFGECPVYEVTIDGRGNVTYVGRKFVRIEGRRTARIPVARVAALLDMANEIGFFDLRDKYRTVRNPDGSETFVTDLPTTIVTITRAGATKRVEDYYGAPDSLHDLELEIDNAAGTSGWVERGKRPADTKATLFDVPRVDQCDQCAPRDASSQLHHTFGDRRHCAPSHRLFAGLRVSVPPRLHYGHLHRA